ncbi:MAG: DUF5666 domain-containing protein [Rhizomicrobium sp.]
MRARFFTLVSGALLFLGSAQADPPAVPAVPVVPAVPAAAPSVGGAAQRYRGTLTAFDGPFLTLTLAGKKTVTLGMTVETRIVHNRALMLADLQTGSYVGAAALKGADGKLRAQGIRVYPPEMRGQGEGEYAIDPANPMRLLINGAVTSVTPGGIGGVVTVAFRGAAVAAGSECAGRAAPDGCSGAAAIQFARGVPIIGIEAGNTAQLLPGATVSVSAAPDATGTLVATSVTVERDAPPPKLPVAP